MEYPMQVIARIHSEFSTKFGVPRQSGLVDDLEEIRNSLLDNYLGDSKRVLYAAARSARMKFLDSTSQARE